MVAADTYSNPDDPEPREFIKKEFKRRGMVEDGATLDPVEPGFDLPADLDLEQLVRSDWAAYQFAETWRKELMIPDERAVRGSAAARRHSQDLAQGRPGGDDAGAAVQGRLAGRQEFQSGDFFSEVAVTRGTTLAIDWETRKVRTLAVDQPGPSLAERRLDRDRTTRCGRASSPANIDEGLLELGSPNVQIQNKTLRVRAMGQMLHMMGH